MGKEKESEIVEGIEDEFVQSQLAFLVLDNLIKSEQFAYAGCSFDQYLIAEFVEIEDHQEYHLDRIADRSSLVVMESMIGEC